MWEREAGNWRKEKNRVQLVKGWRSSVTARHHRGRCHVAPGVKIPKLSVKTFKSDGGKMGLCTVGTFFESGNIFLESRDIFSENWDFFGKVLRFFWRMKFFYSQEMFWKVGTFLGIEDIFGKWGLFEKCRHFRKSVICFGKQRRFQKVGTFSGELNVCTVRFVQTFSESGDVFMEGTSFGT